MTKYLNKKTGAVMDFIQVQEAFESTLVWDGETNPEDFLMDAYVDYYDEWFAQQDYEEIVSPDPVKPETNATRDKSNRK